MRPALLLIALLTTSCSASVAQDDPEDEASAPSAPSEEAGKACNSRLPNSSCQGSCKSPYAKVSGSCTGGQECCVPELTVCENNGHTCTTCPRVDLGEQACVKYDKALYCETGTCCTECRVVPPSTQEAPPADNQAEE